MARKALISILVMWIIVIALVLPVGAFTTETHEQINGYIVRQNLNNFSLDSYLKEKLVFKEGASEVVSTHQISEWIEKGGEQEDQLLPVPRSFNHFHDPVTDDGLTLTTFDSALFWAQAAVGSQGGSGNYSWRDVRKYFYEALTAPSESSFSDTFRGLGQLMHLVSDMSVPEHVRNDPHVLGSTGLVEHYEQWVKGLYNNQPNVYIDVDGGTISVMDTSVAPIFFDSSAMCGASQFPEAPVPIANLFDMQRYDGFNPEATVDSNSPTGLAEYTNANFLSPDTIFNGWDYQYPALSTCDEIVDSRNDRLYLANRGYGEKVDHLAAVSWLYLYRTKYYAYCQDFLPIGLDRYCYEEYARYLIPRAVGYSANLMAYFFRGEIEIGAPDTYVYSVIDGGLSPQEFKFIKAKLRNVSAGEKDENGAVIAYEDMKAGELIAVAKYKERTDYVEDLSNDPPEEPSEDTPFSSSVSAPIPIAGLSSETPEEFTFDFSNDPIPAGVTDLYLQVVFKGTLGNEENIAVAVGMKDLSEPMHLTYWNSTDYFVLYGELKTAEEIENDPLVSLYGYIYPYNVTEEISFAASEEDFPSAIKVATIDNLPPARYSRLIVLTDGKVDFWSGAKTTSTEPPEDKSWCWEWPPTVYQETVDIGWEVSPIMIMRGLTQHQMSYYIRYYPDFVDLWYAFPAPPENALGPFPVEIHFP